MNFDANRLAKLAGLPVSESRTLTEASNRSRHEDPSVSDENDFRYGKNQLAEQGGEREVRVGKVRQLVRHLEQMRADREAKREASEASKAQVDSLIADLGFNDIDWSSETGLESTAAMELEQAAEDEGTGLEHMIDMIEFLKAIPTDTETGLDPDYSPFNEVVEIDEAMLQNEIKRMRQERIEENALRRVIRGEIGNIIGELDKKSKKIRRSSRRRSGAFDGITKGFPGPGFR